VPKRSARWASTRPRSCSSASGYKRGEALLLENIGLAELALGRLADAERSTRTALALAHECGMRPLAATLLLRLGVVQTAAGERAAARASLDAAAAALRSSGNGASTLEVDAALAAWALAGEDLPQAISHVERMLPLLQQGAAPGAAPLPMTVYASAWRVLQRACSRSERIADAGARRDFLAIADHRLLLAD
jgi:tetratricopeptide (TPR) repeat protein